MIKFGKKLNIFKTELHTSEDLAETSSLREILLKGGNSFSNR